MKVSESARDPLTADTFEAGIPFPIIHDLQSNQPIFRGALPDGTMAWNLVRYKDVSQALRNPQIFAAPEHGVEVQPIYSVTDSPEEFNEWDAETDNWKIVAMMAMNAPQHGPHRQRFKSSLRKERVETFRHKVRDIAMRATANVRQAGEVDGVEDYAAIVSTKIVCAYLGIAEENHSCLRRLSAAFMGDSLPPAHSGRYDQLNLGTRALRTIIGSPARAAMNLIHECWRPQPWLADELATTIDRWEIEDIGLQAITAGIAGLRNCIGAAIDILSADWAAVASNQRSFLDQLPLVAEEVIRLASPLLRARRIARSDIRIYDCDLRPGETILLWLVGANIDPKVFEHPQKFLPFRNPNPHLSFGAGPHHCLGSLLARMEVEECLRAMLLLWGTLDRRGRPIKFSSNVVNEYSMLPISVT